MSNYDYIIIIFIAIAFIFSIIYIIKNKGCSSSECNGCKFKSNCNRKKTK